MSHQYTHTDHAHRCVVTYFRGEALALRAQYVQARIGRTQCCARVVEAWDTADGQEMWQLDLLGPIRGRMSTPAYNVRQCSGLDGRCTCTPADPLPEALAGGKRSAPAGACALPDGNHGETLPRESEA